MTNNIDNIDKAIEEDIVQCTLQYNLEKIDFGNCPICYEDIKVLQYNDSETKPQSNMTTTPCGHSFCYECLSKHLERKNKCPICRAKISNKTHLKSVSVYEGCYLINEKVDEHFQGEIDNLIAASYNLNDKSVLIGSIKTCMYDALTHFRRLQLIEDSDED